VVVWTRRRGSRRLRHCQTSKSHATCLHCGWLPFYRILEGIWNKRYGYQQRVMSHQASNRVYDNPRYYEIAFSFRDITYEVTVFEEVIHRFSHVPVRWMLELGCGPAGHMPEIMQRGYEYIGIDLNPNMLAYANSKAVQAGCSPTLLQKDMVAFDLEEPVDFAFILLGSLYVSSTAEFGSHFESMARALRPGGLYLLHFCVQFNRRYEKPETWTVQKEEIRVESTYSISPVDLAENIYDELGVMKVNDHGENLRFEEPRRKRLIFAGEFRNFIQESESFEFVGWWNSFDLEKPIPDDQMEGENNKIDNQIVVVRRI
jgi:SAM-dependent methyltransferase